MASDGPSPHSPSLRLGLPAPQPSRRHNTQSLLGPSFHDPRTHHLLESHPERAALSPAATMSDVTPSALTLSLHCASILQPTTPPQVVAFEPESKTISAPICLNQLSFLKKMCKKNIKSLKKNAQENHQITQKTKNRAGTSRS